MDDKVVDFPTPKDKKPSGFFESELAQNVTAENYLTKANLFLKIAGTGFLIALKDGVNQGTRYHLTAAQWGAWRAYYSERKISVKFMDVQGKAGNCWTVPAEWPHLFDLDASVQRDHEVGEWFKDNYRAESHHYADAATKAATVAAMRLRFPQGQKRKATPAAHLEIHDPARQAYVDSLLKSHAAAMKPLDEEIPF
jgi:hypothetical protein